MALDSPYNARLVDALRGDYQHRLEPNFAARASHALHEYLPGLDVYYPLAEIRDGGVAGWYSPDRGDGGMNLSLGGEGAQPEVGIETGGLFARTYFNSVGGAYLYRADNPLFEFAANYTTAADVGLTIGAWVKLSSNQANQAIISKYTTVGNQRSYLLRVLNTGIATFLISDNGVATYSVNATTYNAAHGAVWDKWVFVVGRYTNFGARAISIAVNNYWDTNAVGIPGTIFNGTAQFEIGSSVSGSTWFAQGYISNAWKCRMYLPNRIVQYAYEQQRAMYNQLTEMGP